MGPKVAVVLSSGSMKAIASLALFEWLETKQIGIDLLVGCSGGGIMSALYACGYDREKIIQITSEFAGTNPFSKIDYRTLMNIANLPFGDYAISRGLLKKDVSMKMCEKVFGARKLEELRPPTLLQATDIQSGEGLILSEGRLAEAVYATSAFYPLLPPIHLQGRWLVDGAYTSVLPVMEAVKRDADVIIAMLFQEKLDADPQHFMGGFHNVLRTFAQSAVKSQLTVSIDFHHHEVIVINVVFEKSVPMSDAAYIPELLEAGRRAVELKKDAIVSAMQLFDNKT